MGRRDVCMNSPNLKLNVGNKTQLWNKLIKEVELGRIAGPYENIPFQHYIQSPIGLVPKDNGAATRLIFHLSYPRASEIPKSLNANTPPEKCTVTYSDFDKAVRLCIMEGDGCYLGKSDVKSAFRNLAIRRQDWCLLIMKAECPTGPQIVLLCGQMSSVRCIYKLCTCVQAVSRFNCTYSTL